MTDTPASARFVVDRREGKVLVLEDGAGQTRDIPARQLPADCRAEGSVLDVPVDGKGAPLWSKAVRNRTEEKRLLREAAERLARLRRTDPGGDIEL